MKEIDTIFVANTEATHCNCSYTVCWYSLPAPKKLFKWSYKKNYWELTYIIGLYSCTRYPATVKQMFDYVIEADLGVAV